MSTTTRGASDVPSAVALIPARGGSQRVPGKNVRSLHGHPLLAYAIAAARQSGVFDAIAVSTDDPAIAATAARYGAEVPGLRPAELATSTAPDIEWVEHVLGLLRDKGRTFDVFSILRPTSPFRTAATIRRAWAAFTAADPPVDSLRAVEPVRQHPGKMWVLDADGLMRPLLDQPVGGVPFHSSQYQALPRVHVQNSSLEIAWTRLVAEREIAGRRVLAFLTERHEGLTIDYPDDVERAEAVAASGAAPLPPVDVPAAAGA
jgi:N-acylneuraminate cytidylyltransferase